MKTQNKINHDSTTNQEIKGRFVRREVYLCMSSWMLEYQEHNECWFEEFDNLYLSDEQILENYCTRFGETAEDIIKSCKDNGEDIQEIFEYWAVSEFLWRKLREHGEPVAEINNTYIWGRTCTGQAILLDYVISKICEEMEILEGQKYSWAK